mgnify:FL=1
MKKHKKRRLLLAGGFILLAIIAATHISKYNTTLYVGSDYDYDDLLGIDTNVFSQQNPTIDLKIEIDGKTVYGTDSADFNRWLYTRRDIPLRAGFHKIKITSESMDLDVEKIRYTLFDHYIVIELFPPSPEKGSRRARVMTGFMPFHFM